MSRKIIETENEKRIRIAGHKQKSKNKKKEKSREFIKRVKDKFGCSECGCNANCSLEFHHLNDKKYLINRMIQHGYTIKAIKQEIRKCIILCSNCHRKKHYKFSMYNNQKFKYSFSIRSNARCNCGESNLCCLDFHHLRDKIVDVSEMIRDKKYTLQNVKDEIEKCRIVCSNCHRKLHCSTADCKCK